MTITDALSSLLPSVEWTLTGDDLSTLEIHTEGVKAPTQSQIAAEIARLTAAKESARLEKEAAKAALLTKLGISAEEAALLKL